VYDKLFYRGKKPEVPNESLPFETSGFSVQMFRVEKTTFATPQIFTNFVLIY
jgi:hypothetical protein